MNRSLIKASLSFLSLFVAQFLGAAPTVTQIAAGDSHSLFIKSDGSLWAMGNNGSGQLGDGTFNNTNRPVEIVSSGVVAVAAGSTHSLFIKSDGSLWAMGDNTDGELGDGSIDSINQPELIVSNGVVSIACGTYFGVGHSLFTKSDGSLWAMGDNYYGQLGDGTDNSSLVPEKIVSSGVVAVAAGFAYSLFLKSNGSLWGMGFNTAGELGDGTFIDRNRPEQIVASGVTAIAAGEDSVSLIIKSGGSLWGMGANYFGVLGGLTDASSPYGDQFIAKPGELVPSNVMAISEGGNQTLFIKSDGSLWGMGSSSLGELGDGTFNYTNNPEQIVAGGVVVVAAGNEHSLFVKPDGSLWGMGDNGSGQLGDGFSGIDAVTTNGDLSASSVPEQIFPPPQPVLTASISSQTNLQFSATCLFGGIFCLLARTDLTVPLNQWAPVWTNVITNRTNNVFTATLTDAISSNTAQQFYILQSQ